MIACGALARELAEITRGIGAVTVECLPAKLHNRPEQIPDAVRRRVRAAKARRSDDGRRQFDTILVGYMDCGTGGLLDRVCEQEQVQRLPGAHCYELYAGSERFFEWHNAEPGTFYLTDYMVRHFERIVMDGLGINAHPELADMYFGNYTRAIHLAQTDDAELARRAEQAAARLGLRFERIVTGCDGLAAHVVSLAAPTRRSARSDSGSGSGIGDLEAA